MDQKMIIQGLQNLNIPFGDKAFDEKIARAYCHLPIKADEYYPLLKNSKRPLCR